MLTKVTPSSASYGRIVNRIGWSLTVFFLLYDFVTIRAEELFYERGITSRVDHAVYAMVSSIVYMAPFLLAAAFFYVSGRKHRRYSRERRSNLSLSPVRCEVRLPAAVPLLIVAGLGINLVAYYLNAILCEMVMYVPPAQPYEAYFDEPWAIILYMTTALAPAFAEEFLFRGVIYGNLRPYGRTQAILISAATFSLMHENPAQLLYTFVCGIMLAIMYEWTGNIWCGIFFHLLNNELAVIAESLLYGRYGAAAEPYLVAWDLIVVVMGVMATIILLVYARRSTKEKTSSGGIFGRTGDACEAWDSPLGRRDVGRALRAPGMLAFAIMAVLTIARLMVDAWV